MVPPRSDRISRVPPYSRTAQGLAAYGAVTRSGRSFQIVLLFPSAATGLVRFRSPLLSESLLMSFPPGTEMFQFPGFASNPLSFQGSDPSDQSTEEKRQRLLASVPSLLHSGSGFPHSEIRGSKLVRSSPRLIAAYHVLHRLRVPRHPPNALKALDRSHYPCPPVPGAKPRERDGRHF